MTDAEYPMHDDDPMPSTHLLVDDFLLLARAAEPLWDELARLGWVDDFGGMEFRRVFPRTLDFIHAQTNQPPH